jgi:hypothetical protein
MQPAPQGVAEVIEHPQPPLPDDAPPALHISVDFTNRRRVEVVGEAPDETWVAKTFLDRLAEIDDDMLSADRKELHLTVNVHYRIGEYLPEHRVYVIRRVR